MSKPDERAVYLALRHIFVDGNAELRVLKKIREKIRQHDSAELTALIREYNLENVSNVAKRLLENDVFGSTLKAKLRFPESFDVSPAQSAARTVSGREAAEAEEVNLKRAAEMHQESSESKGVQAETSAKVCKGKATSHKRSLSAISAGVPSLYPAYLPMKTQHVLLNELQRILELACYNFVSTHAPHVLEERDWTCAESVELNAWQKVMMGLEEYMSDEGIGTSGKSLTLLLADIAQIRHTAVHRLPVTASRIEQFLLDALSLTRMMNDDSHGEIIARLRRETEAVVEDIKRNKDLLEARSANVMRRVLRQQAELEQDLQNAINEMVSEDKEFRMMKGRALEQAIASADKGDPDLQSKQDEEPVEHSDITGQEKTAWTECEDSSNDELYKCK